MFYWISDDDIQVICGCYKGSLSEFEDRVKTVHVNNPQYLDEYLKEIEKVKMLIN